MASSRMNTVQCNRCRRKILSDEEVCEFRFEIHSNDNSKYSNNTPVAATTTPWLTTNTNGTINAPPPSLIMGKYGFVCNKCADIMADNIGYVSRPMRDREGEGEK